MSYIITNNKFNEKNSKEYSNYWQSKVNIVVNLIRAEGFYNTLS